MKAITHRLPRLMKYGLTVFIAASWGCGGQTVTDAAVIDDRPIDAVPKPACSSSSPEGLAGCVEKARYVADLEQIAVSRPPGSAAWQATQDLCAQRLEELGFAVERHDYGTGINVIGRRAGTTDTTVIVSAHYDSTAGCAGADDNGTGVAGALEAARVLATTEFMHTLVVACWDEEERGHVGSQAYALRATERAEDIAEVFVFEMIGYRDDTAGSQSTPPDFELIFPEAIAEIAANDYRGDFIAVAADETAAVSSGFIETYGERLGVSVIPLELTTAQTSSPLFADLRRSDHDPFWREGVSAMMITDTANFRNTAYHCQGGEDGVWRLDHDFAATTVAATVAAAAEALQVLP